MCSRLLTLVGGQQIEMQAQQITGLRLALDSGIFGDIGLIEGSLYLLEEFFVFFRLAVSAEGGGHFREQPGAVGEIGRADHILGCVGRNRDPVAVSFVRTQQTLAVCL